MSYVTWEGPEYTSVHHETCGHLGKHQGGNWQDDPSYTEHPSFEAATRYAEDSGRDVEHCSCTD